MDLISENSAPLCHFRQYKEGTLVPSSVPEFWEVNGDPRGAPGLIKHQWALLTSWGPRRAREVTVPFCPLQITTNTPWSSISRWAESRGQRLMPKFSPEHPQAPPFFVVFFFPGIIPEGEFFGDDAQDVLYGSLECCPNSAPEEWQSCSDILCI